MTVTTSMSFALALTALEDLGLDFEDKNFLGRGSYLWAERRVFPEGDVTPFREAVWELTRIQTREAIEAAYGEEVDFYRSVALDVLGGWERMMLIFKKHGSLTIPLEAAARVLGELNPLRIDWDVKRPYLSAGMYLSEMDLETQDEARIYEVEQLLRAKLKPEIRCAGALKRLGFNTTSGSAPQIDREALDLLIANSGRNSFPDWETSHQGSDRRNQLVRNKMAALKAILESVSEAIPLCPGFLERIARWLDQLPDITEDAAPDWFFVVEGCKIAVVGIKNPKKVMVIPNADSMIFGLPELKDCREAVLAICKASGVGKRGK